jgi:hypothetical protein
LGTFQSFVAAGYLSGDDRRTQLAFGQIIGRGDIGSFQKGEQMIALLPQAPPNFFFLRLRPWTVQQGVGA